MIERSLYLYSSKRINDGEEFERGSLQQQETKDYVSLQQKETKD